MGEFILLDLQAQSLKFRINVELYMMLEKAKTVFQSFFPIPPSSEELIAIRICSKISALRNNTKDGDAIAKKAIVQIIDFTQKNYDEKISTSIKAELEKCHRDLLQP